MLLSIVLVLTFKNALNKYLLKGPFLTDEDFNSQAFNESCYEKNENHFF